MSPIAGIDLGTTNSLIGVMDAGFPVLLADTDGGRLTPSVVHFPKIGEPLVGRAAARMRTVDPKHTVYSIKRFIGRRAGEEADDVAYALAGQRGAPVRVRMRDRDWSPEEISELILRKLKGDAERALGQTIDRAVITVPAYFNEAQRAATKVAGELAGLTVERIVNEPTAAALAYGLDKLRDRSKVAVFDLGGGTFDISILELNQGVFQVLSTNGNTRLGGDDIDAALFDHVTKSITPALQKFPNCAGLIEISLANDRTFAETDKDREIEVKSSRDSSGSPISFEARLHEELMTAKHRLSDEEQVAISLPFAHSGGSILLHVTRGDLEKIAHPIIARTRPHCLRALADAGLQPHDLDAVILVGGQTRMPLVREFVAEIFEREPDISQHPDEAIALGATLQAGVLSGAVQNVVLLDVTPLSLGIETFGGLMNVIIPRNSTIPTKAGEMFTNAVAGQRAMLIKVLQGERELAKDNWPLGQFELPFEPAPKGQARVGVQFEIDANGLLHVLARDTKTGAEKVVEVTSAIDVSDEAVEKMLEDSLEHAFEDVNARVFTEAKLKAEELLPAVRAALEKSDALLSPEEKADIAAGQQEVERALALGAAQPLKAAIAALDQATQRLAALLIEEAMRHAEQNPSSSSSSSGQSEED
ncbi:MAG TPA: Hsp70 family protein [Chthoniobacteraceae bacterium]|nr:Hsp70 family protein [Chthoniobacteraceae bacterium]